MKIKEFIQRYKIILFLSFLVVVLIFLKLRYGSTEENVFQITPTPTAVPTMTYEEYYPESVIEISE